MKVGDYVRTKYGIKKIYEIDNNKTVWKYKFKLKKQDGDGCVDLGCFSDSDVIKSSPNIIDLIEVGDYVNGNKIVHIQEEEFPNYPKRLLFAGVDENNIDDVWEVYNKDDIKSIVTKEAFEHMEYMIGE